MEHDTPREPDEARDKTLAALRAYLRKRRYESTVRGNGLDAMVADRAELLLDDFLTEQNGGNFL